jgi:DNA processing protein
MNVREILLHLSLIKCIGPGIIQRLISALGIENLSHIYSFSESDFVMRASLTLFQAKLLHTGLSDKSNLLKELGFIEKHAISWVTFIDQDYPSLLKEIYLPPTILYYRGSAAVVGSAPSLAFVGSRRANQYAKTVISRLVPDLVACNWSIISGGALGADTFAHEATLSAKGTTIAVLGSGLLRPYPASNATLFQRIIDSGGCIVSSFPLEEEALPGNFPARNRIISGLSHGCLVVQAAERSGAKITAGFALEQSREVFAIPGRVDDPLSVGCHQLIQQGAKLVSSAEDIFNEFGYSSKKPEASGGKLLFSDSIDLDDDDSLPGRILRFCSIPRSIDFLMAQVQLDLSHLQELVFELHLDGKLIQDAGGLWMRS